MKELLRRARASHLPRIQRNILISESQFVLNKVEISHGKVEEL